MATWRIFHITIIPGEWGKTYYLTKPKEKKHLQIRLTNAVMFHESAAGTVVVNCWTLLELLTVIVLLLFFVLESMICLSDNQKMTFLRPNQI